MKITEQYFYEHELTIEDDNWKIDFSYESSYSKKYLAQLFEAEID